MPPHAAAVRNCCILPGICLGGSPMSTHSVSINHSPADPTAISWLLRLISTSFEVHALAPGPRSCCIRTASPLRASAPPALPPRPMLSPPPRPPPLLLPTRCCGAPRVPRLATLHPIQHRGRLQRCCTAGCRRHCPSRQPPGTSTPALLLIVHLLVVREGPHVVGTLLPPGLPLCLGRTRHLRPRAADSKHHKVHLHAGRDAEGPRIRQFAHNEVLKSVVQASAGMAEPKELARRAGGDGCAAAA